MMIMGKRRLWFRTQQSMSGQRLFQIKGLGNIIAILMNLIKTVKSQDSVSYDFLFLNFFRFYNTFFVWVSDSIISEVMKIFDDTVFHCDQFEHKDLGKIPWNN